MAAAYPGCQTLRVPTGTALDASRPTGLRFAGFVLTVAASLLVGIGALATWVTVGVRLTTNTDTPIPGVDLADGKMALACAVVMVVAMLAERMVASRGIRMALAGVIAAAGAVAALIGGAFLQNGVERAAVVDAIGIPRARWADLEVFRELGIGPYLVLAGGIFGAAAGVLTLVWARRQDAEPLPTAPAA
jgi:hypothetical protein